LHPLSTPFPYTTLFRSTNVINRPPVVAPFGGRVPRLTTNPLCFAGPMPNGRPPLVVDIATSAIAINKARVLAEKGEPAPENSIRSEEHTSELQSRRDLV